MAVAWHFDIVPTYQFVSLRSPDLSLVFGARGATAMAQKLVQVHFSLTVSGDEYIQAIAPLAQMAADLAGLQWKIWLLNDLDHVAGGLYLFADESSVQSFLASPFLAQVQSASFVQEIQVRQFDVLMALTDITRGPLSAYAQGL
jgi:hypothetical protein